MDGYINECSTEEAVGDFSSLCPWQDPWKKGFDRGSRVSSDFIIYWQSKHTSTEAWNLEYQHAVEDREIKKLMELLLLGFLGGSLRMSQNMELLMKDILEMKSYYGVGKTEIS